MKFVVSMVFLLIIQIAQANDLNAIKIIEIKNKIKLMFDRDQNIRTKILATQKRFGSDYVGADSRLFATLKKIDKQNTEEIRQILNKFGWPTKYTFGSDVANEFWSLAQHADDLNLQKTALRKLLLICKHDSTELKHYAYLYDRIQMKQNIPQLFGTQGKCVGSNNWQAFEVVDKKNINQLRRKMNLGSFEQYQKRMNKFCY